MSPDPAHRGRGKQLVLVDCAEESRPILERAGLTTITTVTSLTWRRP